MNFEAQFWPDIIIFLERRACEVPRRSTVIYVGSQITLQIGTSATYQQHRFGQWKKVRSQVWASRLNPEAVRPRNAPWLTSDFTNTRSTDTISQSWYSALNAHSLSLLRLDPWSSLRLSVACGAITLCPMWRHGCCVVKIWTRLLHVSHPVQHVGHGLRLHLSGWNFLSSEQSQ